MDFHKTVLAVMLVMPVAAPVLAQSVGSEVQRDINQETRVEQGLKSGQLSTGEAARLERGEARIDRMESKTLKDGNLYDVTGDPNSASSQRMKGDVQRNINQQNRIEQGVQSGQLTNREASRLERGQARVNRAEARVGADGHLNAREQARIQHRENMQSKHIFRDKHNGRQR